jgi:hypothetical protein
MKACIINYWLSNTNVILQSSTAYELCGPSPKHYVLPSETNLTSLAFS